MVSLQPATTAGSSVSTQHQQPSSALIVSALSGAAVAGIAMHYATRGRLLSSTEQAAVVKSILQHVDHGLMKSSHKLETSLLSQEALIQKSLQPVKTATQQLSNVQNDVSTLKNVLLHAPTTRGNTLFGEFQLKALIQNALPAGQYVFQATLSNGKRADCLVEMPNQALPLAIDSKFPLDGILEKEDDGNEKLQTSDKHNANETNSSEDVDSNDATLIAKATESPSTISAGTSIPSTKKLHKSLYRHIDDISTKYIIPGETADFAILFLPSETLLLHILQNDSNDTILLYAHRQRVYLACPTTLLLLLTQLHGATRNLAVAQDTTRLVKVVHTLLADLDRLIDRYHKTDQYLQKVTAEMASLQISMAKIQRNRAILEAEGWTASTVKSSKTKGRRKANSKTTSTYVSNSTDVSIKTAAPATALDEV